MDSSSSGSLQSSSGGGFGGGGGGGGIGTGGGGSHEEEYTSGGTANHEILSPFLPLINSSSTQYHHYPFSNSLDHHAFSLNPNPSLPRSSLDSPWAAPSSTQFVPPSCTNNDTTQLLNPVTSASMMHPPVQSENNRPNMATTSGGAPAAQRGAKKRSRASRRPPTTVLTTDTSNFRAMVQEFTGFPAAPFVPSSPFVRPRLGSGLGPFQTGGSNTGLNSPYLLRPFPQKLQTNNPSITPSNLTSSTIVDAIASIARSSNLANLNSMFGTSNANANATSTSSSGSNTANFVNASSSNPTAAAATNNSTDPISSFASLHSHQATNSKYNFGAQAAGDLDGLVGSNGGSNVNPMRLACDGYERDKSSRFVNSEFDTAQAMDKGVFGFLNYADLKDKR